MADVDNIRSMDEQAAQQRDKLEAATEAGDVAPEDRDAILDCFRSLRRTEWSAESSQRDRLSQLRLSAERAESRLIDFDGPGDVDRLLDAHEAAGAESASAQRSYATALRSLFEWLDTSQERVGYSWWEDISIPNREDRRKDPEDMLDESEVAAIREHADKQRTRVYVEFLHDTGLRAAAASQLRVGDVDLDGPRPTFSPNRTAPGQKGLKEHELGTFPLKDSVTFLRQWLNSYHPEAPDPDPDAPLFPVLRGYDPEDRENCAAHPRTLQDQIDKSSEAGGISKKTNLHSFRHACVKRLKLKYEMDWDQIRDRLAWSDHSVSEMVHTYGRLDADERLSRLFQQYGTTSPDAEEAEEEPPTTDCPNCSQEIERSWSVCPHCGTDPSAAPSDPTEELHEALEVVGAAIDAATADGGDVSGKSPARERFEEMANEIE